MLEILQNPDDARDKDTEAMSQLAVKLTANLLSPEAALRGRVDVAESKAA